MSGERAGFVRDAFHEIAITGDHIGVMVDDFKSGPIELRSEPSLGNGHAHCV